MQKSNAITITFLRENCIGCNYCVEIAPHRWAISKADGKCNLIGSNNKKGYWSVRVPGIEKKQADSAAKVCPVNIIKVSIKNNE